MKTKKKGNILLILGGLAALLGIYEFLNAGNTDRIVKSSVVILLGSAICGYGGYIVSKLKK